jgi:hypothetical protein
MKQWGATLFSVLLPAAAFAQGPTSLHATYDTYAAGMHVAQVETGLNFGLRTYQVNLGYHTMGLAGLFVRGHQVDLVNGGWNGLRARPVRFVGEGSWRGIERHAQIDYQDGRPIVRQLVPPNTVERESVPDRLQVNTVDTLSALVELIRIVDATGRCEAAARTFDGRRVVDVESHTVGEEMLEPTSRSSFAGRALRCDFSGRMLAGFLFNDDRERDGRPMHGSAWLGSVTASAPRFPVRITFETKWFGEATMYLTDVGPGSDVKVAHGN